MRRLASDIGLKILAVERGEPSPYAKVEVTIVGQTICIRWGVDDFTYPHLKRAFQTRCFDTMPGVKYEYFLRTSYRGDTSGPKGVLDCCYEGRSMAVWFRCSLYFVSNIEWFRSHSVGSVSQLAHLAWEANQPAQPGAAMDTQ